MMSRYQRNPDLLELAKRRNQTLAQLLNDWAVSNRSDLLRRCQLEEVNVSPESMLLVDELIGGSRPVEQETIKREVTTNVSKKGRKKQITLDETADNSEPIKLASVEILEPEKSS